MFKFILAKLQTVAPVLRVIEENNELSVSFDNYELSEDEQNTVNSILATWPLEKLRYQKIELLDNNWNNTIQSGWTTPYGWKLGLTTEDVTLLNGVYSLAKEAANMGLSYTSVIIDTDGISHEFNLSDLTNLILQYGQARAELSKNYSNSKQSILNATSLEQLQ